MDPTLLLLLVLVVVQGQISAANTAAEEASTAAANAHAAADAAGQRASLALKLAQQTTHSLGMVELFTQADDGGSIPPGYIAAPLANASRFWLPPTRAGYVWRLVQVNRNFGSLSGGPPGSTLQLLISDDNGTNVVAYTDDFNPANQFNLPISVAVGANAFTGAIYTALQLSLTLGSQVQGYAPQLVWQQVPA